MSHTDWVLKKKETIWNISNTLYHQKMLVSHTGWVEKKETIRNISSLILKCYLHWGGIEKKRQSGFSHIYASAPGGFILSSKQQVENDGWKNKLPRRSSVVLLDPRSLQYKLNKKLRRVLTKWSLLFTPHTKYDPIMICVAVKKSSRHSVATFSPYLLKSQLTVHFSILKLIFYLRS